MGKAEKPIISVSGVRGEIGVSLDVRVITQFAMAFGTFIGGRTVVVGRDSRTSSPTIRHAVLAGLFYHRMSRHRCRALSYTNYTVDGEGTACTRKYYYHSES